MTNPGYYLPDNNHKACVGNNLPWISQAFPAIPWATYPGMQRTWGIGFR